MERELYTHHRQRKTAARAGWRWSLLLLAAAMPVTASASASHKAEKAEKAAKAAAAQPATDLPGALRDALREQADPQLLAFYEARGFRPLWVSPDGASAAQALAQLVATAEYDSLDPAALPPAGLGEIAAGLRAPAPFASQARAELALSRGFARYVIALRQAPPVAMRYEDASLRPAVPSLRAALEDAARAPSLTQYVQTMRWMNPLYAPLRQALVSGQVGEGDRRLVVGSLQRIRGLPASPGNRYVLVDTANARLWMYEGDQPVDSMKVVVGKVDMQTPMMAGYIRHAIVNPYWNVPPDLVRNKIAPNVLKQGPGYMRARSYQVLTDWTESAQVLDPAKVDWKAVADGTVLLRVRQLPSIGNAMGKIKYEFPNPLGIYLHDTPEKNLMLEDQRQFSSGCIRLEDAQRLGRWLFRGPVTAPAGADPEQRVDLPELVPVYVTYLTARPDGDHIALGSDPYNRDRPQVAEAVPQVAMNTVTQ